MIAGESTRASQLFKVENLYDGPPSPSLAVFVAISNDRRLRRAIVHPVQIKQLTRPGESTNKNQERRPAALLRHGPP